LADAIAFTRGCTAAVLLAPDGSVAAVAPRDAVVPAPVLEAVRRGLARMGEGATLTVLLPRYTVIARRLPDQRVLLGLLEPRADSATLRGALDSVLPVTLAPRAGGGGASPFATPPSPVPLPRVSEAAPAGVAASAPIHVEGPVRRRWPVAWGIFLALGALLAFGLWILLAQQNPQTGGVQPTQTLAPTPEPSAPASAQPSPSLPVTLPSSAPVVNQGAPVRLALTRDLAYGSSGPDVQTLQARLRQLRYFLYPEDTGYFGDATYGAVYTFQRDRHLPTTGVADQATVSALNACDQSCSY
jgi:hypothetical protein